MSEENIRPFPKKLTPEQAEHIARRNREASKAHPEVPPPLASDDHIDHGALDEVYALAERKGNDILLKTMDCDLKDAEGRAKLLRQSMQRIDLASLIAGIDDAHVRMDQEYYRAAALAFLHQDDE